MLFQGGLRRSEAAALEWRDIAPAATEDAILVTVRRSKTDQEGTAADVRYLKKRAPPPPSSPFGLPRWTPPPASSAA